MHLRALLVFLVLVALLAAGCTGDTAPVAPTPAVGADTALVAPEALASFLPPPPPGWHCPAPPSAVSLEEDGVPFVSVTATYVIDDPANRTDGAGADVTIQDTGGKPVGLRRLADRSATAGENGTASAPTMLRGLPALVYDDGPVTGAYLVVADRYVVCIAVTGGTRADLDAFVAALDLEALSRQR